MCGEDVLGSVLSSAGSAAVSVGAGMLTNQLSEDKAPKVPKVEAPAQAAPVRRQDTGAIVKIGGIDDAANTASASAAKRRGGSALGNLGAYTAL